MLCIKSGSAKADVNYYCGWVYRAFHYLVYIILYHLIFLMISMYYYGNKDISIQKRKREIKVQHQKNLAANKIFYYSFPNRCSKSLKFQFNMIG